jgi:hypothetical protein
MPTQLAYADPAAVTFADDESAPNAIRRDWAVPADLQREVVELRRRQEIRDRISAARRRHRSRALVNQAM